MAESKNSSTSKKTDTRGDAPERRDHSHGHLWNHPHASFRSKVASSGPEKAAELPPKLQAKMEQLLADLAALEEPSYHETEPGDLIEITFETRGDSQLTGEPRTGGDSHHAPIPEGDSHRSVVDPADSVANVTARITADRLMELESTTPDESSTVLFQDPAATERAPMEEPSDGENLVAQVVLDDLPTLAEVSSSFGRQAREILEIIKRRQEDLAMQKNELELREASLEKRMRQERLALVERQRQLEQSVAAHPPAENRLNPGDSKTPVAKLDVDAHHSEPLVQPVVERKITPEWIAAHERSGGQHSSNQNPDLQAVIKEFVVRQVQHELEETKVPSSRSESNAMVMGAIGDRAKHRTPAVDRPTLSANIESANSSTPIVWQRQAEILKQQHETAIRSMRQTRRQLELLKDILAQQQSQWAKRVDELEVCRLQAEEGHSAQQQHWLAGIEDLERLRTMEQNESAKRKTFLDHREAAVRESEERLQQAQVEVLRERVVLRQLERTVRQSMSNADWNQRWQVISEETQSYLKKVHEEAETVQAETKRKLDRLESRKSEMLLYRESLRNWIERQMKLVSRRVAHSEDREYLARQMSAELLLARRELKDHQDLLNEMLDRSFQLVDERLEATNLRENEAA